MKTDSTNIKKKIYKQNILIILGCLAYFLLLTIFLAFSDAYKMLIKIEAVGLIWTMFALIFTIYAFILPRIIDSVNMHKKMIRVFENKNYLLIFGKDLYTYYERISLYRKVLEYLIYCLIVFMISFTLNVLTGGTNTNFDIVYSKIISSVVLSLLLLIYTLFAMLFRNLINYSELLVDKELDQALDKIIGWRDEEKNNNQEKEKK